MQSSTCQHMATLQFVSSAETDAPIADGGQHPLFWTKVMYLVLPHMEMNMIEYVQ